jgi:hypothetical protein
MQIVALLAELNGLKMQAADVGSAYLEALASEKVYFIAGPDFGEQAGHALIICKALHGLRTSGARWGFDTDGSPKTLPSVVHYSFHRTLSYVITVRYCASPSVCTQQTFTCASEPQMIIIDHDPPVIVCSIAPSMQLTRNFRRPTLPPSEPKIESPNPTQINPFIDSD